MEGSPVAEVALVGAMLAVTLELEGMVARGT